MPTAVSVANFFVKRADQDGRVITPLQLMKLVYIAHGWHLAVLHRELFDEPVKAWQYGPVVPSVYHAFKGFGSGVITELGKIPDGWTGQLTVPHEHLDGPSEDLLERVWQQYCDYSAGQLVHLTHQPGTPWFEFFEGPTSSPTIPNNRIQEHFEHKAQQRRAAAAVPA